MYACSWREGGADGVAPALTSSSALRAQPGLPPIHRLPRELMRRIFTEVIGGDGDNFHWIAELSCVCPRWRALCGDPLLWEFVAKRSFVVYPLIVRLEQAALAEPSSCHVANTMRRLAVCVNPRQRSTVAPQTGAAAAAAAEAVGGCSGPLSPQLPLTRESLRQTVGLVQHYRARQQHYAYVQRRRSFVLHLFLSATLLSLSLAIAAAMCAAESVPIPYVCTRGTSFAFLWLSYLCIVAIIVSNVVMQAHFEPQPLGLRLRRNKLLIVASAAIVLLGVLDVMVPTILVQINMSREKRFSWLWCGTTVIVSFCVWQAYALVCIMPDARAHLQHQLASLNVKAGLQFVMMNVPNAFPLIFAAAAFCALQYVQVGSRLYVFLGGIPVVVSLGILALVFLLDYLALHRTKDLSVALCLVTALFFPLSLLRWDFRGWCLFPLAASVLGFFLSHARFVVRRALQELRAVEHHARAAGGDARELTRREPGRYTHGGRPSHRDGAGSSNSSLDTTSTTPSAGRMAPRNARPPAAPCQL